MKGVSSQHKVKTFIDSFYCNIFISSQEQLLHVGFKTKMGQDLG